MDVDCYQAECDSYVGNERNIIDQLEQEQTKTDVLGQLAGWSPTKISHKYNCYWLSSPNSSTASKQWDNPLLSHQSIYNIPFLTLSGQDLHCRIELGVTEDGGKPRGFNSYCDLLMPVIGLEFQWCLDLWRERN